MNLILDKILYSCTQSLQKWKERSAALEKNTKLSQETKEKWLSVVTNNFMSYEESDGEEIVIHPLPWRSARVDEVMSKIDDFIVKHKSPQARRQMKSCKIGAISERHQPHDAPRWAIYSAEN